MFIINDLSVHIIIIA